MLSLGGFSNALASSQCTPANAPLLAHYEMDTARDSLIFDSISQASAAVQNIEESVGLVSSGFRFGLDSQVIAPSSNFPVTNGLSVSVWVKPFSFKSPEARFFSQAYGVQNSEHFLMGGTYGTALRFRLKTNGSSGTTTTLISPPNQLSINQWTFVTFTYNGSTMSIFRDGALVSSTPKQGNVSLSASIPLALGNQPPGAGSRPYYGAMDDLRIFGRALSQSEITGLMNASRSGCTESQPVQATSAPAQPLQALTPVTTEGWPSNTSDELAMAGIFYGQQEAGLFTGNTQIGYESSRRFRAEKTGFIDAVRYNNRTLLDENIKSRCLPSAPDSLWCKCVNAGLDRFSCGYTLGNSYSVGNGGAIVIEIREDDGTSNKFPGSRILGKTAGIFVPLQRANEHYPILSLEQPVRLEAGKLYHLVYKNLNPPTNCQLNGRSVSEAASCPRNQGAIGLNGTYQPVQFGSAEGFGPFGGTGAGNLVKPNLNGGWSPVKEKLSWYEVRYTDGIWVGDSHTGFGSTDAGRQFISGNTKGRQVFTVRDASRRVNGLWVYFGHTSSQRADGSPMSVTLKDAAGRTIANGSIKSSPECAAGAVTGAKTRDFRLQHCRTWGYTDLSSSVNLVEGQRYSVEFSAGVNAGFTLHTFFPLDYGHFGSTNRNFWQGAHAEVSKNNGQNWSLWSGSYRPERDINMLFTLQGMPKQLP